MAEQPGQVIRGRYRILGQVGKGAHGVVYRARDLETRGVVALKFLGKEGDLDPAFARRLEREASSMARLRGTSAVYVHGLERCEDGRLFIVMEMLYGQDFETYLESAERLGGRLKAAMLLQLLRPIVDTLEAAHRQGIVHRDLKPSNVFIVDLEHGGGVRLLDFGLVKLLDAAALTADGMVAGTPSYIAPEAWRGDPKILDHRIDVYALGVIVFRALSGRLPYPSKNMIALYEWAREGERPSLSALRPKLPREIDDWVQRALAVEPEDRFQDVRTMWNALEALLAPRRRAPF